MPHRMKTIYLGENRVQPGGEKVGGEIVTLDGEEFYRIANHDRLPPFLMSIASSADLWMFISSNSALTAGRRNPDDKIHDSAEITGPKTIVFVERGGRTFLWEPFSEKQRGIYRIRRNLYKNFSGGKIYFEEVNGELGLAFRHGWAASEEFGWVRKCSLANVGKSTLKIRMLDGLQNLLPCGITSQFQLEKSTLVDAYKKNELVEDCGLGLFLLSSIPVDRPEPAESLRATTVWATGVKPRNILLSSLQLENFRQGLPINTELDVRAARGAYLVETLFNLRPAQVCDWMFIADVEQGPANVAKLRRSLRSPARLQSQVEADIKRSAEELWKIVAQADGLQKTARPLSDARHFNNVLCNVMRGGIFCDGYQVEVSDLRSFVLNANRAVVAKHVSFFRRLGEKTTRDQMLKLACKSGDPNLERICHEYLPLTFSRRHGDPSRPWNRFSISPRRSDGQRVLNYEGNWRDIFQNWEALAVSFPGFVSGMICKFVNASTADGYNPYRVTRDGFDWEIHDPHDPWSHIGYWGDHQIIYLLKLLEIFWQHEPSALRDFLTREIFCFANVPYRIKPYAQLLKDPRDTVEFDSAADQLARQRVPEIGADGKLVLDKRGQVLHVNLAEKLLIPLLAKFANFIPGAGIWLNTQRPEWNDANNALVGNGVSMVTLYQLRRHLAFCREIFSSLDASGVNLSGEVADWFSATTRILKQHAGEKLDDRTRREVLDELGRAGEMYRGGIYGNGFSGKKIALAKSQLLQFFSVAMRFIDESIRVNKRPDGLYHAYNLVELDDSRKIPIRRLYEMLEGQAAILSSNFLSGSESLDVLRALRDSALYRADQHSYLLYPDRQLPRFLEKNNLSPALAARSPLLKKLLVDDNRMLIECDISGACHFNSALSNARDVKNALAKLSANGYTQLVRKESTYVLNLFEKMFDHRSFTGRSGTFFGYEGLGCIYWHMVSKLLLAAQDAFNRAANAREDKVLLAKLAACFHEIRAGIGDFKSPENYGAFPMDPYSHTPGRGGARQPGLTGQVKEDILCRFGELGVSVNRGQLEFNPRLLRMNEFLSAPATFIYCDVSGNIRELRLKPGSLAFTYCQVPIVYYLTSRSVLEVRFADGRKITHDSLLLDEKNSRATFERRGSITTIFAGIKTDSLS
jgi:hypothetical protein